MSRQFLVLDDIADLNKDGKTTPPELAGTLILFGGGLFVISGLLVGSVYAIFFTRWWAWVKIGAACVIVAILGTMLLLVVRVFREEREERLRRAEIFRRRELEDEDRAFRMGLQDQDNQTRINQADVDWAVYEMLTYYFSGRSFARGKVKGVSDPLWNLANDKLKKAKLRTGRGLTIDAQTMDEAWSQYLKWRKTRRRHYVTSESELIKR